MEEIENTIYPDPAQYPDQTIFMLLVDGDGTPERVYRNYTKALFAWYVHYSNQSFPTNFKLEVLRYMNIQLGDEEIDKFVQSKLESL